MPKYPEHDIEVQTRTGEVYGYEYPCLEDALRAAERESCWRSVIQVRVTDCNGREVHRIGDTHGWLE